MDALLFLLLGVTGAALAAPNTSASAAASAGFAMGLLGILTRRILILWRVARTREEPLKAVVRWGCLMPIGLGVMLLTGAVGELASAGGDVAAAGGLLGMAVMFVGMGWFMLVMALK